MIDCAKITLDARTRLNTGYNTGAYAYRGKKRSDFIIRHVELYWEIDLIRNFTRLPNDRKARLRDWIIKALENVLDNS